MACVSASTSLRAREAQNPARFVGRGDLAPEPARDADHALDQHGVVFRLVPAQVGQAIQVHDVMALDDAARIVAAVQQGGLQ